MNDRMKMRAMLLASEMVGKSLSTPEGRKLLADTMADASRIVDVLGPKLRTQEFLAPTAFIAILSQADEGESDPQAQLTAHISVGVVLCLKEAGLWDAWCEKYPMPDGIEAARDEAQAATDRFFAGGEQGNTQSDGLGV